MVALNRSHREVIHSELPLDPAQRPQSATSTGSSAAGPPIRSQFQQALSALLLQQASDPAAAGVGLNANSGQQTGTSQDSGANSGSSSGSSAAVNVTSENALALHYGLAAFVPQSTISSGAGSGASSTGAASANSVIAAPETSDDAYWDAQPPAVRQLRNISNETDRENLAAQLASQGYKIDNAIMVWGWDATKTMELRQSFGYTWVPSLMQANVTAAPGLSGGGIIPYDPDDPPAGSIPVVVPTVAAG